MARLSRASLNGKAIVEVEAVQVAPPRLRGVSHEVAFVVALPVGIALAVSAQGTVARGAAIAFASSVVGMFGVSTLFHRIDWQPDGQAVARPDRPHDDLRADRRHLHADRAPRAPSRLANADPRDRLGRCAYRDRDEVHLALPHRGGFAPVTCLALGGVALVALPQIFTGIGTAGALLLLERRRLLHRRRRRLRDPAARPATGDVRLPRDLPLARDRRGRVPVRDGGLLRAAASMNIAIDPEPRALPAEDERRRRLLRAASIALSLLVGRHLTGTSGRCRTRTSGSSARPRRRTSRASSCARSAGSGSSPASGPTAAAASRRAAPLRRAAPCCRSGSTTSSRSRRCGGSAACAWGSRRSASRSSRSGSWTRSRCCRSRSPRLVTSGAIFRAPLIVVLLFCLGCIGVLALGPRLVRLPFVSRSERVGRIFTRGRRQRGLLAVDVRRQRLPLRLLVDAGARQHVPAERARGRLLTDARTRRHVHGGRGLDPPDHRGWRDREHRGDLGCAARPRRAEGCGGELLARLRDAAHRRRA